MDQPSSKTSATRMRRHRPPPAGRRWPGVAELALLRLAAAPSKPPAEPSIMDFPDLGLAQLASVSLTSLGNQEHMPSGATSIPKSMSRVPGPGATFTLKPSVEPTTEREVP